VEEPAFLGGTILQQILACSANARGPVISSTEIIIYELLRAATAEFKKMLPYLK
jgi:hypothetical protein